MQRQIRLRTALVAALMATVIGWTAGSSIVRADSPFRLTRWLGIRTTQNSGTSFTVNLANGILHNVTLTGNVTAITFSNLPTTGYMSTWTIALTQDGTGSRTVTGWPAAVKWPGGTVPTVSATAGRTDIVQCTTWDGGTTDYCVFNQNFQ